MPVLDTDHLTEYQKGRSEEAKRLKQRLDDAGERYATTIISVEEVMRGWMAALRRQRDPLRQVNAYMRLRQLFRFFASWSVLDWSDAAAAEYAAQRGTKVRIGAMDLKIASTCLVENATLLSRNSVDFDKVSTLRVEDWLS